MAGKPSFGSWRATAWFVVAVVLTAASIAALLLGLGGGHNGMFGIGVAWVLPALMSWLSWRWERRGVQPLSRRHLHLVGWLLPRRAYLDELEARKRADEVSKL